MQSIQKKVKISASQLFIMLFLSRTVVSITYSAYVADVNNMWDVIPACLTSFFLTLIMAAPVYFLYKKSGQISVLDCAHNAFKRLFPLFAIVYAIYFLWVLCYTLSIFDLFVTDVMNVKISAAFLSFAVIAASVYGAFKGVEALARTSTLIFALTAAVFIFLAFTLFAQTDENNYKPFFYNGAGSFFDGVLIMLARNSCIPAMAVLLPMVKNNGKGIKKGIAFWCFGVYASAALIIFLTVGVLGDYLTTQPFPIYTAAGVAGVGVVQRLDSIFLGVWTAGIFLKSALFILLVSLCIKKIWGEKAAKRSIPITGAAVLLISYGISKSHLLQSIVFSNSVLLALTLLAAVILPLVLLIKNRG